MAPPAPCGAPGRLSTACVSWGWRSLCCRTRLKLESDC
ncbi:MAG: hypothetical protein E6I56_12715 [Chloroflexi bacterium]|nr:MAG: hypothetical protein E6I56_12715 [Chloroflexota bacterium]